MLACTSANADLGAEDATREAAATASTTPPSATPSSSGPTASTEPSSTNTPPPSTTTTATAERVACRQDAAPPTDGSRPAAPPGAHGDAAPNNESAGVSGRIPPEVIQNPVRRHFHCFRRCYERALPTSPNLAGSVTVSFAIQRGTGAVIRAKGSSTTIASQAVIDCVVDEMRGVQFPAPDRGDITVTYPIAFSPQ